MFIIPSQGFRHAVTLLLSTGVRRIAGDASPRTIEEALITLADELVALSDDIRAAADVREWVVAEYVRTIEALPLPFDVNAVKQNGARILERVGASGRAIECCDLFLVYAPEDRLPIAAPLAIELTKRRVRVAFSEYEVATREQTAAAIEHGLLHHRTGAVLVTAAFERRQLLPPVSGDRIRLIRNPHAASTVDDLINWVSQFL